MNQFNLRMFEKKFAPKIAFQFAQWGQFQDSLYVFVFDSFSFVIINWCHFQTQSKFYFCSFLSNSIPFLFCVKNMLSAKHLATNIFRHCLWWFSIRFLSLARIKRDEKMMADLISHFASHYTLFWDCNFKKVNHLEFWPVEKAYHLMFNLRRWREKKSGFTKWRLGKSHLCLCQSLWTISNPLSWWCFVPVST